MVIAVGGSRVAVFENRVNVDARDSERRNEPEYDAATDGNCRCKCQYAPVQSYATAMRTDARNISGTKSKQGVHSHDADHQPEHTADEREQHALSQKLPDNAVPGCA